MPVPTIRFPGFTGEYEERPLSDFLSENKEKNRQNLYTKEDVKSVSGDFGVVNQIEFFGKSMAGADVSNYHVVHHNDIVYTKSPLKANPYGIIKCNTGTDGIVSTLYAVYYCDDDVVPEYVDYYFGYDKRVNKYLLPLVNIGAKHDMKVNNQDAISGSVFFPSVDEQKRVVEALKAYDERIKNQRSVIEALEVRRKGLLQQIFSQEIRFKADDGSEFPDWESKPFGEVIEPFTIKTKTENEDTLLSCAIEGMFLNSELFDHQRGASNKGYLKIKKGTLILSTQNLHLGNANVNLRFEHGIISPAYKTYNVTGCLPEFMGVWVKREAAKKFFYDATTTGASQCRRNVDWDKLYSQEMEIPCESEQRKISVFVALVDKQIQIEKDKLEAIKLVKKGLLQQMFV